MHSPKKVSPPKVDGEDIQVTPNKKENFVTVGRKNDMGTRGFATVTANRTNQGDAQTDRPESARKDRFGRQTGDRRSEAKNNQAKPHDLMVKTDQNMFDIDRRTR